MYEFNLVDQIQFLQQNGADETIKVAARNQPVFLTGHGSASSLRRQTAFVSPRAFAPNKLARRGTNESLRACLSASAAPR
jgi:hypothetical protein